MAIKNSSFNFFFQLYFFDRKIPCPIFIRLMFTKQFLINYDEASWNKCINAGCFFLYKRVLRKSARKQKSNLFGADFGVVVSY